MLLSQKPFLWNDRTQVHPSLTLQQTVSPVNMMFVSHVFVMCKTACTHYFYLVCVNLRKGFHSVADHVSFLGQFMRTIHYSAMTINLSNSRPLETVQGVLAPFVMDNLNCSGAETAILDCPGAMGGMPTFASPVFDGSVFIYNTPGGQPPGCDPFLASYAFVACGMTDGPGRLSSCFM